MSLIYDQSYQEWKKTHPDPIKPRVVVDPVVTKKKIIEAQKPKAKALGAEWSPQMAKNMGFKTRAEWRAWKRKGYAGGQRGSDSRGGYGASYGGGLW